MRNIPISRRLQLRHHFARDCEWHKYCNVKAPYDHGGCRQTCGLLVPNACSGANEDGDQIERDVRTEAWRGCGINDRLGRSRESGKD